MSERADLVWHRCLHLGELGAHHRALVGNSAMTAGVVAVDTDTTDRERVQLSAAGLDVVVAPSLAALVDGTTTFDVVLLRSPVSARDLDTVAPVLALHALVVIDVPGASPPVELIDALRTRFAAVTALSQTRVSGSALLASTSAVPRLFSGDDGRGHLVLEHTVVLASDWSLESYPSCSIRHEGPDERTHPTLDLAGVARRVARRVTRRLRPGGAAAPVIHVPSHPAPMLSIVIPVHGKWSVTEGCLAALGPEQIATPAEVIVVNDASPDDTLQQLERVPEARVVDLTENLGFLGASNAGLKRARGELVLFLNNDTIPQPGALDRMVETMRSDPTIGVVGAKLVYLDRSLQEAGGVVWSDGSAWNIGRNEDPASPRYSYPLEVDYCSGAALLVRRALLDLTGGFDTRFSPAYYEDTDLCFEARRHGLRVVYEPRARVVHLEGQSHGTSTTSGVKRYQEINRSKFAEKWAEELADHLPPETSNPHLAKSRLAARRVLVVDHTVPTSDRDGGSLRMLRLLGILRELGCFVWFYPADGLLRQPYTQHVLDLGIEVIGPRDDLTDLLRNIGPGLDTAIVSRRGVAWRLMEALREHAPSARVVFDTVDLHFLREEREGQESGSSQMQARAARGRSMELALTAMADQTWVVSTREKELLTELVSGADVRLVPNVHDAEPTPTPHNKRADLVFVGNFNHPPNVDALVWLDQQILPMIRQALPEVRLHVVGDALPDDVRQGLDGACVVHGWVQDLEPIYAASRLAVAPLRYGAGMKGKVTEALARGVPVVTTEVGVEGMPPAVRALVRVADTAEELAQAIVDSYGDVAWWTQVHDTAPGVIGDAYGQAAVRRMVIDALGLAAEPR